MSRPKIFTADFWTVRVDALTEHTGRALRTGCQFVLAAVAQDVTGANLFDVNLINLAGVYLGGVFLSLLTTFALPPADPPQ